MTATTCSATRKDGQPCQATSGLINGLCEAHDPGRADQARARRVRGGHATAERALATVPASELPCGGKLETIEQCSAWLAWIATAVASGRIHPLVAGQLKGTVKMQLSLLKEQQDLARKIKALEEQIARTKGGQRA